MPNHQCHKCDRVFGQKGHLNNHLNKKNTCKQKIIEPIIPIVLPILPPNPEQAIKKIHTCNHCNKSFPRSDRLTRHMKLNCKVAKQDNKNKQDIFEKLMQIENENKKLKDEIDNNKLKDEMHNLKFENETKKLKDELDTLKNKMTQMQSINNVTNNILNNNTNNGTINNTNIIMVAYGKEDLSKIDTKILLDACKRGYNSIPQMVESIHFNPNYPEFNNVYIPDIKNKHAMVYDKDNWILKNKDEVVSDMYDSKKDYIMENITEINKSLNNGQQKTLQRWLDSDSNKDDNIVDKKAIDSVYDSLKLLLYNCKHITLDTKNKLAIQGKQQIIQ